MISDTQPATFHEVGYLRAEQEQHPWYLVERDGEIGLVGEVERGEGVISTYEP